MWGQCITTRIKQTFNIVNITRSNNLIPISKGCARRNYTILSPSASLLSVHVPQTSEFLHLFNNRVYVTTLSKSRNICSTSSINNVVKPGAIHEARKIVADDDENQEDVSKPYVIYNGLLTRHLKHIKIFSLATSMMGLTMQPVLYQQASEKGVAATVAMLGMIGFFTYVTPILIHQLAKKYVTDILYDPSSKTYTAITYNFFLMKKELKFSKDDVSVPDVPGPFTSVIVSTKDGKKIPLFLTIESFKYPNHFGLLMGYDKPLNLHMTGAEFDEALKKKKEETEAKIKATKKKV